MTKAKRIFDKTYTECRVHVKNWGVEHNPDGSAVGFAGMITEEAVAVRTLNDIQKLIDSERKTLDLDEKLGVSTAERLELRRNALDMVQSTKNNSMKSIREYEKMLAEI